MNRRRTATGREDIKRTFAISIIWMTLLTFALDVEPSFNKGLGPRQLLPEKWDNKALTTSAILYAKHSRWTKIDFFCEKNLAFLRILISHLSSTPAYSHNKVAAQPLRRRCRNLDLAVAKWGEQNPAAKYLLFPPLGDAEEDQRERNPKHWYQTCFKEKDEKPRVRPRIRDVLRSTALIVGSGHPTRTMDQEHNQPLKSIGERERERERERGKKGLLPFLRRFESKNLVLRQRSLETQMESKTSVQKLRSTSDLEEKQDNAKQPPGRMQGRAPSLCSSKPPSHRVQATGYSKQSTPFRRE